MAKISAAARPSARVTDRLGNSMNVCLAWMDAVVRKQWPRHDARVKTPGSWRSPWRKVARKACLVRRFGALFRGKLHASPRRREGAEVVSEGYPSRTAATAATPWLFPDSRPERIARPFHD